MIRIGQGYDVHPFEGDGRKLILGGVEIAATHGLAGHSDGDALTHAIIDALLGAAALGDIGTHFPSSREDLKDADSIELLKGVAKLLAASGCSIVNIDSTIVAQEPRMAPHVAAMRDRISHALAIDPRRVSIKATTTDGLGSMGRVEGIAAQAVCLIESS
jgi:2-C-methyl-D-erythritol 2,4-cyclodiphosphate synthase